MTETTASTIPSAAPAPGDPRHGFAHVVQAVGDLIQATTPAMMGNATPCPEFTAKELIEHLVQLVRQVAAIGNGQAWSSIEHQATDDGWLDDYQAASHDIMQAWADPAMLQTMHQAPWGPCPGGALIDTYAAELATHGWDLSQATGINFEIDDDHLRGALAAIRFISAEGRDAPDMPFAPVIDPGADAPVLLQIAGWLGRPVAAAPGPDDPRYGLAHVVNALGDVIQATTPDMLDRATPCPEFTVKELLEHCVLVVRRIAAIGNGQHWSTVEQQATDGGWLQDYRAASHDIMQAWSDPAKLQTMHEVPWGEFPGAVLMYTYTAELATHGWDLSQATGLDFDIADELLQGALTAIKFVPAEGRDDPDMPFSAVVDPGEDATVLLQIAGWAGRNVLG